MIIIIITLLIIFLIGYKLNYWQQFMDEEKLHEYIASYGNMAPLVFGIVQFIQVIISPIPGNVTTLVGGALFGMWKGFFISSVSIILGSIAAFALAKIFGRPLVIKFAGVEKTDKYFNVIKKSKKIFFVLMFLLPFFPDDLLCFIAGISGMSWAFFIITIVITRPLGLLASSYLGSYNINIPVWMWIIFAVVIIITVLIYRRVSHVVEKHSSN